VGTFGILARLNEEKVPPIGRDGKWERSYVRKLLNSVSVLGIYQPRSGSRGPNRKPDGEPIPGYYPAVISEDLWYRAHKGLENRMRRSGRPAVNHPNPFAGLLRCALDDCPLHVSGGKGHKYLVSANALQKVPGSKWRAFPLDVFTSAVIKRLEELKGADLFADPGAVRLTELTKNRDAVELRLTNAEAQFERDPESQKWQEMVSKYDRERRAIVKELADERQKAANPLSAVWAEAVELMARDEPDRLRGLLLSTVEDISVVIAATGGNKFAAVQVSFRGGEYRHYAILHRPLRGSKEKGKPADTAVKTFSEANLPAGRDLRNRSDANALEKLLLKHLAKARPSSA
jgi:hypothetical protein